MPGSPLVPGSSWCRVPPGAGFPPGVFLLEVQYSVLKSLISTCVLSYVGSRKERIGYLTESASLKRTAGIV